MWKRTALALSALLVTLGIAGTADAETCVGVSMPDSKTVDGTKLVLNGMGLREATIMSVDVYVAGLYVESKSSDGDALASSDSKKQLVLHFVRDVGKQKIVDTFRDRFDGGTDAETKAKLKKLLGWLSGVDEGDEQVYTYIPGEGLTAEIEGSEKGTIEGADFAETFFEIWLGSDPPNQGLKSGLLGGSCG